MVERYRIAPEGFAAHMRPSRAVDMVFSSEHDDCVAELEAENERLRNDYGDLDARLHLVTLDRDRCAARAEALSRTGAVKEAGAELAKAVFGVDLVAHPRATNTVDAHETANVRDKPAAPEGRQDDGHNDADGYPYEHTRPSEQAVTEAMVGPDEIAALQRALTKAEDGAGTLPAKQSVKLRPADWHALGALIRALGSK